MTATRMGWIAGAALIGTLACAPPPPPGAVYIERRPPPERVEEIGVAPGRGYVFIRGYWRWSGRDFDWVGGRWERIERDRRDWVPGRWRHSKRGWYWMEGHWR